MKPGSQTADFKLATQLNGEWIEHRHVARFSVKENERGRPKLTASIPGTDAAPYFALTTILKPPYFVLYILHTPRGEGEAGRYQSTELSREELTEFLEHFEEFWVGDGRFDLWVYSLSDQATVVWDRHNFIHAYGPVDEYALALSAQGFVQAPLTPLSDHVHHYRAEFDSDAGDVLDWFSWVRSPLRPEDEQ